MNDLDAELETVIRSALATDASRAPRPAPQWDGLARYTSDGESRRRQPWIAAAAVGLAAAAIGGAIGLRSASVPKVRVAAFVPPGVEYPLTDLGPATQSPSMTTLGLTRELIVNGGDIIKILRTIDGPASGPTASERTCVTFRSSGFCPTDMVVGGIPEAFANYGEGMSSVDGVTWTPVPEFEGTVWTKVPMEATYVSFIAGSQQYWQRPVAGIAIFPFSAGDFVAYNSGGRELRRVEYPLVPSGGIESAQRTYDYSDEQHVELHQLTEDSMAGCLKAHGGDIAVGTKVAVFDPNVDERRIWDGCVLETKRIVGEQVTAMNVHSHDPPQVRGG